MKRYAACFMAALVTTFGILPISPATAQEYPNRAIRLVIPFPAGGVSDSGARILAKALSDQLGQHIYVENIGGAGGTIGTANVASSKPDGYTLLYGTSGPMIASLTTMKSLPYHPLKNFVPLFGLMETPMVLVTARTEDFRTIADLVTYARANRGKVTYGSPGISTAPHLAGELLSIAAGADLVHVPYKGTGPAALDLLAARIDFMFDYATMVAPHIANGKLRPLALSTSNRIPAMPEVPTAAEAGFEQVNLAPWGGLFLPAGTPQAVIDRLLPAIRAAVRDPLVQQNYQRSGSIVMNYEPAEFTAFIEREIPKWRNVIERSQGRP